MRYKHNLAKLLMMGPMDNWLPSVRPARISKHAKARNRPSLALVQKCKKRRKHAKIAKASRRKNRGR